MVNEKGVEDGACLLIFSLPVAGLGQEVEQARLARLSFQETAAGLLRIRVAALQHQQHGSQLLDAQVVRLQFQHPLCIG